MTTAKHNTSHPVWMNETYTYFSGVPWDEKVQNHCHRAMVKIVIHLYKWTVSIETREQCHVRGIYSDWLHTVSETNAGRACPKVVELQKAMHWHFLKHVQQQPGCWAQTWSQVHGSQESSCSKGPSPQLSPGHNQFSQKRGGTVGYPRGQ